MSVPSQGLQLLSELEKAGAITETSLTLPPDIPYDRYEALVTMFGQLHRTSAWLLGDALNYGEKVYGETYAQATVWTGLAEQTLTNYASVCGRIPRSRRRRELPFSVHAEIASLEPEQQKEWLKKASEKQWTRSILRDELAPMRAAKQLEESREKREKESSLQIQAENLPPAVASHICHCTTCGRAHRSDLDVEEE
jgi:hypothetical protein